MSNKLIVFGAGGQAKVVIDLIQELNTKVEILVATLTGEEKIDGVTVLKQKEALLEANTGVVAVGDNFVRETIVKSIMNQNPQFEFVSLIHPSVVISNKAQVGKGSVILAGSCIQVGAQIKEHCIVNTGSNIDHDVVMNDFSSVAPGVTLGGDVVIGRGSAISLGVSVIHGVKIEENVVIGAGAVVVSDIKANQVAFGVPCKVQSKRVLGDKYL